METANEIVENLRKWGSFISLQDIFLAVLCLLATYLLRSRQTYDIQPSWHWDQNSAYYRNGNFPTKEEKMPPPLVADLDSDGRSEIIILTYDFKLEVYKSPAACEGDCTVLPYLNLAESVTLNISSDGRPIIMESGFIDSIDDANQTVTRKQVIIILTSKLDVLCYNHDLQLIWQTRLMDIDDPDGHYKVKAMSVLVTSHALKKNDRGSMFIGVSYQHTEPSLSKKRPGAQWKPTLRQMGVDTLDRAGIPEDEYEHFSTFALHGATGVIRWHHLPGDFETTTKTQSESFYQWKLSIHDRMAHVGEVHWTHYLKYILSHLPHHWSQLSDTRMKLTSLMKTDTTAKPDESSDQHPVKPLLSILGLEGDHIEGLPFGGMLPHNQHEHVKVPTALLIHNHNGIQVLDLKSGSPITRLEADSPWCVYGDVGSEGALTSVCVDTEACLLQAERIHPNTQLLFSGPTCEAPSMFSSASLMASVTSHRYTSADTDITLPPVLVNSVGKKGGLINHLLGHRLSQKTEAFDSLVLTSAGRLSSYASNGHLNWQVFVPSGWDQHFLSQPVHSTASVSDKDQVYKQAFQPALTPMSHLLFGKQRLALVSGWSSVSLVDVYDGYVLADHSLPCQPIHTPVIADFNNDGRNDIIITCSIGHIGFTLEKQPNYLYTAMVGVAVVLSIKLLSWCCKPEEPEETDSD